MKKTITVLTALLTVVASLSGCGKKDDTPQFIDTNTAKKSVYTQTATVQGSTETATEAVTEHISPIETVTARQGTQIDVDKTIQRSEGSNTLKLGLGDFIEEGDRISSFTFIIYSADGNNIGTFKGGCGISVSDRCSSATSEGWYQSDDFTASTQGTYAEIKWEVPENIKDFVSAGGEVLFGYWWGNAESIRIESAVCSYERTRDISVDGTIEHDVGKSADYDSSDNMIAVPLDFLPENSVPQTVTFNISSSGKFGKFTGAFACKEGDIYKQSADVAIFTDDSSLSLTWFLPEKAKNFLNEDGEVMLGYWWGKQKSMSIDSIEVKYSEGSGTSKYQPIEQTAEQKTENPAESAETGSRFRTASQITGEIKAGWNLGNTLECYDYTDWTKDAETAWGNMKTTPEMIEAVKEAGFNAVRIPVTWGEHLDGDTINKEWLDRVQEVVDYAYSEGLFVILNMHHDDYIWFNPTDEEYPEDSRKYKKIWEQISERFRDYGDTLIFEGMNEPRTIDSPAEWSGGTHDEREVINRYAQDFVSTVRSTGGNNSERSLVVTTYSASAETSAINDIEVPDDKNIIVSVHYYAPWKFSEGTETVFGDSQKRELDGKFDELRTKFIDKGIPLIIGEFGCVNSADEKTRSEYYEYYVSSAKKHGIKCFVWDNGVATGKSSYGIFNRANLSWNTSILDGIMRGTE